MPKKSTVNPAFFTIEVAYATPDQQVIISLQVKSDTTLECAIEESGILEKFQEIDLAKNDVGIFGQLCKTNRLLQPGDRVEIYRPLEVDPKESRRARQAQAYRRYKPHA